MTDESHPHDHYYDSALTLVFAFVLDGPPERIREAAAQLLQPWEAGMAGASSFAVTATPRLRLYLSASSASRLNDPAVQRTQPGLPLHSPGETPR